MGGVMEAERESEPVASEYRSGRFRLLAILIAAMVIGERSIYLSLDAFSIEITPAVNVIAALVLTALLFPILYYAVFKDVIRKNEMLATTEGRLRAAHNWLEKCINERTQEIRTANQKLEDAVQSLKHQRHEMVVLAEMGHLLQACGTVEEACKIVEDHIHRLFPGMSGALYLADGARKSFERVTAWGKGAELKAQFETDDCWAARNSRPHQVDGRNPATLCHHRHYEKTDWHLCLPMMAQGETVGLICLQAPHDAMNEIGDNGRISDDRLQFYVMIADSLALAVANLRLRQTLQVQAVIDPLTGLYNRRYFDDILERELSRAARSQTPLSLVMLDIDDFKRFNDTYGHSGGDALLQAVGEILQKHVRDSDIACRFGGDEFMLVLPGATAESASQRVRTLKDEIKAIADNGRGLGFGEIAISVGTAEYPRHAKDKRSLAAAADKALYESKQAPRASVPATHSTNEKSAQSNVA